MEVVTVMLAGVQGSLVRTQVLKRELPEPHAIGSHVGLGLLYRLNTTGNRFQFCRIFQEQRIFRTYVHIPGIFNLSLQLHLILLMSENSCEEKNKD